MNKLLILLFSLFFSSSNLWAQKPEKEKAVDPKNKIKKYLQIEDINVPKSLTEIDFEIRQNTIDVVLNSPKYIFLTSKRDKIVNKNYRDYNSLKVTLAKSSSKTYVANIHLENWYSAKRDKKFKVILSKYNMLTDLRMGIYELLYGKRFVRKNREKLIQYSAIRIKRIKELSLSKNKSGGGGGGSKGGGKGKNAPDEDLEKETKEEKKKRKAAQLGSDSSSNSSGKKGKEKEEEKKKEENEEVAAKPKDDDKKKPKENDGGSPNDPKRKKTAKVKTEKEEIEENEEAALPEVPPADRAPDIRIAAANNVKDLDKADDQPSPLRFFQASDLFDTPPRIFINKKSQFSAKLLYTAYNTNSKNALLSTNLDMTFLRFGANINIVEERINPFSYDFLLLAGTSVQNDIVQIPAWRTIEMRANKFFFSNFLKLGVGIESSPYFFVNVPIAGEGQQLYENDVIWAKGLAEIKFNVFRREVTIGGSYAQSLLVSSTIENYEATAIKTEFYASYFHTIKYGVEFSSSGYNFTGTDQGSTASSTGTNYSLNFVTRFN